MLREEAEEVELDLLAARARFGPWDDIRGRVVWVDPRYGNEAINNGGQARGRIGLVRRGFNSIVSKARRLQEVGCVGVLVVNWGNHRETFSAEEDASQITVPVACIGQADAEGLKDGMRVRVRDEHANQGRERGGEERSAAEEMGGLGGCGDASFGDIAGLFAGFLESTDASFAVRLAADEEVDERASARWEDEEKIRQLDAEPFELQGILEREYSSLEEFAESMRSFEKCVLSWEERRGLFNRGYEVAVRKHWRHLLTARRIRSTLNHISTLSEEALELADRDAETAATLLERGICELLARELELQGRDSLRLSLLDGSQRLFDMLVRALLRRRDFTRALVVSTRQKARSLLHLLQPAEVAEVRKRMAVGSHVMLCGLIDDVEWNGRSGIVLEDEEPAVVEVEGRALRVSWMNLTLVGNKEGRQTDLRLDWERSWQDISAMVKGEMCPVIEYKLLEDGEIAVWVLSTQGEIVCAQVINPREVLTSRDEPMIPDDVQSLIELLMVTCARGRAGGGQEEEKEGKEGEELTALVLYLESSSCIPDEFPPHLREPWQRVQRHPKRQKLLERARQTCRRVRGWLKAMANVNADVADELESISPRVSSWSHIFVWCDRLLQEKYRVEEEKARQRLLAVRLQLFHQDTLLRRLHRILIDPILHVLEPGCELLILPHSDLFMLPWAALQDDEGHFLIERFAIRLSPSLEVAKAAGEKWSRDVLLCPAGHQTRQFSAPVRCICDTCISSDQSSSCLLSSHGGCYHACLKCRRDMCLRWTVNPAELSRKALVLGNPSSSLSLSLPSAQAEAASVLSVLSASRAFERVEFASGAQAHRRWLLEALRFSSWAHVACHADAAANALLLAREEEEEEEEVRTKEGRLTMEEIQSDVELLSGSTVVLSACSTGRGDVTGEDVLSLSRGFLAARAGAAVVSLWNVEDEETRRLMERFYSYLVLGLSVPQSLRLAMLEMSGRTRLEAGEATKLAPPSEPFSYPHLTLRVGGGQEEEEHERREEEVLSRGLLRRTRSNSIAWAAFVVFGARTFLLHPSNEQDMTSRRRGAA